MLHLRLVLHLALLFHLAVIQGVLAARRQTLLGLAWAQFVVGCQCALNLLHGKQISYFGKPLLPM